MAHIARDEPAQQSVETREETIARVEDEQREVTGNRMSPAEDPSTRRGFNIEFHLVHWGSAAAAFVVVGLVILVVDGRWSVALGGALMASIVAAVLLTLLVVANEDGRVSDEVAEYSGPQTAPDQNAEIPTPPDAESDPTRVESGVPPTRR